MLKNLTLAATAIAITASGLAAAPAAAQGYYDRSQAYAYDQAYRDGYNRAPQYRDDGYRDGGYRDYRDDGYRTVRRYDDGRRYYDQRGGYVDQRGYDARRRYDDRRYYNQSRDRCRGNTGTIVGAIAGGLLGNAIAGRGDRTLGTVLGAGGGALAGRAVERDGC